jgi:ABC-type sulfate transport system permease component
MIRRFTSAQFVPANAGAKAKNPVGSTLFSTPMVALLRHPGHKILRTCCHESVRKRLQVVLPQVRNGLLAISVFTFIRGWEEYIFVFTFLIRNTNWTMSLYMYYVRDDVMGVDYGVVSAVGVFYLVPSLILYVAAQRYLMQMSIGGVKG